MRKSLKADVRDLYSREGLGELTADLYRQCLLLSFSPLDPRCWLHRDACLQRRQETRPRVPQICEGFPASTGTMRQQGFK